MGAGKSTIISLLENTDLICIPEPARKILYEQRLISASGTPENNPDLFTQLMLSRATGYYIENSDKNDNKTYIFDRGIPDMIAYAELFGLDTEIYYNAARTYRYNSKVFLFEGWEEIYTTDDERKMTYQQANKFGERVSEIYKDLGYNVIKMPKVSPRERLAFINKTICHK